MSMFVHSLFYKNPLVQLCLHNVQITKGMETNSKF